MTVGHTGHSGRWQHVHRRVVSPRVSCWERGPTATSRLTATRLDEAKKKGSRLCSFPVLVVLSLPSGREICELSPPEPEFSSEQGAGSTEHCGSISLAGGTGSRGSPISAQKP